ncbi:hypothetical protein IT084_10855 [Desulfallas sp. Bu1-1]|uniref:hypothetical protein n=1 Tax=Desulfallas sp. Bu1-1 TaxID=2787620 RepID=UPI00189CFD88|nr:hypothetical protein [Desulfallas sp. Bu1-1]MBF7083472.1 hypothetical protein [Desulfallas sp. Bu1-1]
MAYPAQVKDHTVKYAELINLIGNLVIDLSGELSNMLQQSNEGSENLWSCYDKFNTCFEEYKRCQRSLCSFTDIFGTSPEHHNLLVAFNDFIDGIEMINEHIKPDMAAREIKWDRNMFEIGLAKQELGKEKTLLAINKIMEKLKAGGLI